MMAGSPAFTLADNLSNSNPVLFRTANFLHRLGSFLRCFSSSLSRMTSDATFVREIQFFFRRTQREVRSDLAERGPPWDPMQLCRRPIERRKRSESVDRGTQCRRDCYSQGLVRGRCLDNESRMSRGVAVQNIDVPEVTKAWMPLNLLIAPRATRVPIECATTKAGNWG